MLPPRVKVAHTLQCPAVATVTDHKDKLFQCVSAAIPKECLNSPISSGFLDHEGHTTQHIYSDKIVEI